jgi:hypothetical protein
MESKALDLAEAHQVLLTRLIDLLIRRNVVPAMEVWKLVKDAASDFRFENDRVADRLEGYANFIRAHYGLETPAAACRA